MWYCISFPVLEGSTAEVFSVLIDRNDRFDRTPSVLVNTAQLCCVSCLENEHIENCIVKTAEFPEEIS